MKKLPSFLTAAVLLFSLTGCQERKSEEAGKLDRQADLKLMVTARFLRSDGSPLGDGLRYWYLTEQKHEIFFEPAAIKLTAQEPFGELVLTLQDGRFVVEKGFNANVFDKELFNLMTDEAICKALLEIYLAELKNFQTASGQTGSLTLEGQVYDLAYRAKSGVEIYKNKSTQRNDLVVSQDKKRYILYGYNYLETGDGRYLPSKIDVYVYNGKSDRKLIVQYECRLL